MGGRPIFDLKPSLNNYFLIGSSFEMDGKSKPGEVVGENSYHHGGLKIRLPGDGNERWSYLSDHRSIG